MYDGVGGAPTDAITPTLLTGWGRTAPSRAYLLRDVSLERLAELIQSGGRRGVLARGLGRAYGDAACNGGGLVVDGRSLRSPAQVHNGVLDAPAGSSLGELLETVLPQGYFLPVLPGTAHVTVGGAVAADVHGKCDLSLARWLEGITLLKGDGSTVELGPGDPGFEATVGGLGLTGVVVSARIRLLSVSSSRMVVQTRRVGSLDRLLSQMQEEDGSRYQVAWVDLLHPSGRGVLQRADHAQAQSVADPDALRFRVRPARLGVPSLPVSPLRPMAVRAFNEAWFRAAPVYSEGEVVDAGSFFHPLDVLRSWNRLYGRLGFIQYQFVVPESEADLLGEAARLLRRAGAAPFLAVLKRFGPGSARQGIAFPAPGWSLAMDLPLGAEGLAETLDRLDEAVARAGGRVYLAKDSRLRPDVLEEMYPNLQSWRDERDRLDPEGRMRSDLGRRLGLVPSESDAHGRARHQRSGPIPERIGYRAGVESSSE